MGSSSYPLMQEVGLNVHAIGEYGYFLPSSVSQEAFVNLAKFIGRHFSYLL